MKAVVAAFNQEEALVGAFSVITNLRMELFEALMVIVNPIIQLRGYQICSSRVMRSYPFNREQRQLVTSAQVQVVTVTRLPLPGYNVL